MAYSFTFSQNAKILIFLALLLVVTFNVYKSSKDPNPTVSLLKTSMSLSRGDRYFGRLQLWFFYAKKGDWSTASQIEPLLDPSDIRDYKLAHYPPELKKKLNTLAVKTDKSVEDWIELARIQFVVGKPQDALNSIKQARLRDSVRDDIDQIYYDLFRQY